MNDEMNNSLSISTEGEVLKCAKGADVSACGFTPGAKVCGKCGAMPVQMKMVPVDDTEDGEEDDMVDEERAMPAPRPAAPVAMEDAGMEPEQLEAPAEDDEEDLTEEEKGLLRMLLKKRKRGSLAKGTKGMSIEIEDDEDEEGEDEEDIMDEDKEKMMTPNRGGSSPRRVNTARMMKDMDLEDEDMTDEEEDLTDEETERQMMLEKMRKKRIQSMGMKSEDFGTNGYVCAIERKSYSGGSSVCDDCPGGCVAENGLPGLLSAEGIAEQMFDGKVLDSGYSAIAETFVVDVQTKTGTVHEFFIDGTTAEVLGFHKLDNSVFEQKSAQGGLEMIQFHEAADIAVKSIDGHVIGVEPDSFEGIDSYAVEIDGFDGKSYDVFVSLDGEVLGYDKYEMDEAEEIEAEAAEIALKRAFTDDQRDSMSKAGTAMSDGSFPIQSESDLRNAIQAYGRAKDKDAAKRHIMKRAKDMGKESLIPSNWVMGGGTEKKSDTVDAGLMASLIEFELLQAETEIN
jgi:uncharacterized membrane protein YkoI